MRYQSSPSRYRHSSRPRSTQRGGSVALNESRKYYSDKRLEAYNNIVKNVMKDDTNPEEVTIENAYKTRWIWYHTILALEILMTNILLLAILVVLAVKL